MRGILLCALAFCLFFLGCSGRPGADRPIPSDASAPSVSGRGSQDATETPPDTPPGDAQTAAPAEIVQLTVPEGYTLARVGMELEALGICSTMDFIAAAQSMDFSAYPLVAAQPADERRCFLLEGYLFPDTYEIYADDSPESIIHRMLANFETKLDSALREEIAASGYTVDQVLALASIIEKEAFGQEQMPLISSVLYNRLELGMRLQCDVTITYVEGAIKPFIAGDINRYNEHYNTFKCAALPAGPICNPGLAALQAALRPATTDYLFFVTDPDKNYYYAVTYEEHLDNIADIESEQPIEEPA